MEEDNGRVDEEGREKAKKKKKGRGEDANIGGGEWKRKMGKEDEIIGRPKEKKWEEGGYK